MSLAQSNQYFVALIVFLASIAIPVLKLTGLLYLVASTRFGLGRRLRGRTRLYRFIDRVGPWAMLDVFLLAVLVALVKLGQIATILPIVGGYAAGFLDWLFRGVLKVEIASKQATVRAGDEKLGAGKALVLAEDNAGKRWLVGETPEGGSIAVPDGAVKMIAVWKGTDAAGEQLVAVGEGEVK